MSITKGAKKAHRSSKRKQEFNFRRKGKALRAVKSLKKLIVSGSKTEALAMMREAQSALDRAVKGKSMKKNTAARKKSRLARLIKKLS